MKQFVLISGLVLTFYCSTWSQQPTPSPGDDDNVVRISSDLIRIDATVRDHDGKAVGGLTANDFEVYENGHKQTLAGVTYVPETSGGAELSEPQAAAGASSATGPAAAKVRRTFAFVIDDLTLAFPSVNNARTALLKFVNEQMRPDDLVAIIRTGGGSGAIQQFTSDKQLLRNAIEKIHWNPAFAGSDSLASVSQTDSDITERFVRESDLVASGAAKTTTIVKPTDYDSEKRSADKNGSGNASAEQASGYTRSSLGIVRYVIGGLRSMPGRKMMMLFSDGISIGGASDKSGAADIFVHLQEIADEANRSSVVVYTFDTRGLRSMSISAADSTYEIIDGHREQKELERTREFKNGQDGLVYLAKQTGGEALIDSDDLSGGLKRALDEQSGYYLLDYVPDADTFNAGKHKFNKLEVKVLRPGVSVHYRSGFFASPTAEPSHHLNADQQVSAALASPFVNNDIGVTMNALYADDPHDGPYIRSLLHIDASALKFNDEGSGWKKAVFNVAAVSLGSDGVPAGRTEAKYTIKTKGPTYEAMLRNGFVYVLIMPIKRPGLLQYRAVVMDDATRKIGSAFQTVEVPARARQKFAVSSLIVQTLSEAAWQAMTKDAPGKGGIENAKSGSTLLFDTVLRQFRAGCVLRYGYEVYGAKSGAEKVAKLEVKTRILQNDKVIFDEGTNNIAPPASSDLRRVPVSGAVLLKTNLSPGDYVLQVSVRDVVAGVSSVQLFPFRLIN